MAAEPFSGLTLARVLRPWGRRGEVAAEVLTDFPKRLTALKEGWLYDGRNPPRPVSIRSCRMHIGQAVIHFAGSESINDAECLRGLELQIPFSERAAISPGRHYISELVGCSVWEQGTEAALGAVREVLNNGGRAESWVLIVETPRGEVLVPLAAEICTHIDTEARRIEVRLPEGLRDLNL